VKVLLLLADALRADHLGCYGYRYATSPTIDGLSARGCRFADFFAPSIPTQPAHTSIFSGTPSVTNRVVAHKAGNPELPSGLPWLPQLLRHGGVTTAAVDTLADQGPWFARGWTDYRNPRAPGQLIDVRTVNAAFFNWLDSQEADDWFCFVHYWDPHSPYLPPAPYDTAYDTDRPADCPGRELWEAQPAYPFAERWQVNAYGGFRDLEAVRARYDGEIAYLDHGIGELLDQLANRGLADDILVLVTADHGEVMYDHPGFFDHAGLYDDTVHVPLLAAGPGVRAGSVVTGMHQHVDLAPTVLELFGVPAPAGLAGRSLIPALAGEPLPSETELILTEATWEVKWGIRTDEWKLIKVIDPGVHGASDDELFHLPSDPGERVNLIRERPDVADHLELRLRRWWDNGLAGAPDPLRQQARVGVPAAGWVREAVAASGLAQSEWQSRRYRPSGVTPPPTAIAP